jgi:hypothetical protein
MAPKIWPLNYSSHQMLSAGLGFASMNLVAEFSEEGDQQSWITL